MSILDKLITEPLLIKALNRQAAATERLGDLLENLLPSPLTSDKLSGGDLKPASAESFRVYDQREAYRDEQRKLHQKLVDDLWEQG